MRGTKINFLTNQSSIQDEIRTRVKSGNALCHSVQNMFFSRFLSTIKNQDLQTYNFARCFVWVCRFTITIWNEWGQM
jgi:hypothetical protein